MSDLVLWGASGHGKVVLDIARATGGFGAISFIDDACDGLGQEFCTCQLFGASKRLQFLRAKGGAAYAVSIGNNEMRAACFHRALEHGLQPATLVHPSAVLSESAAVGAGTVVMAKAVVNAGARIGRNCIVNTAAVVEHDCVIGDHVHISPGVLLGGAVTVGKSAHIGIGAVVLPGVHIGDSAVVGAGSVVLKSVTAGTTVVGVPSRPLHSK